MFHRSLNRVQYNIRFLPFLPVITVNLRNIKIEKKRERKPNKHQDDLPRDVQGSQQNSDCKTDLHT